jgi:hypothetical protein
VTGSAGGRQETAARSIPRRGRQAGRRLPGLVIAVAVTTIAGYAVLAWQAASHLDIQGSVGLGGEGLLAVVSYCLATVSCPVVGGIVVIRRPGHPAGWLLIGIGAGWLLTTTADLLVSAGYAGRSGAPAIVQAALVAWGPLLAITLAMVVLLVAVFPTGVIAGRWRRFFLRVGALALGADVLASLVRPRLSNGDGTWHHNPIGLVPVGGLADIVLTVAPDVLAALAFAAGVDLVIRWRRSAGAERQQMNFFGYAVILVVIALVPVNLLPVAHGWLIWFFLALNGLAVAIGVAVVRYRLWDIDRVISRTLAYAIVTGLLVGVYAGPVLLATEVFRFRTPVAVAASTLAAAALFNPVWRRVQHAVDRRFNRARYDADQTVRAFAARLQDAVDLDSVRDNLAQEVSRALEPAHLSLWVSHRD